MSGATEGRALLFVESNTSGTGRLFARTARALGDRPVLLTSRPEKYPYLSHPRAPEVVEVSCDDVDALEAEVRRRFGGGAQVAGVTSSSEYFVATAAALAARLGLPGPDPEAIRSARDKLHQRQVLAAGALPTPAFRAAGWRDAARRLRERSQRWREGERALEVAAAGVLAEALPPLTPAAHGALATAAAADVERI